MDSTFKPRRVESPSSILSYKQCPRKYYYQYIEHRPTSANIHTLRGNIVHEVLDKFFEHAPDLENDTYMEQSVERIRKLFDRKWELSKMEFLSMGLNQESLRNHYVETLSMLSNWLNNFLVKLTSMPVPINQAFRLLTPMREQYFISENHNVKGYIDVIEHNKKDVRLMDYKTSSKSELTDEYRLQLSIYALLYKEKYDKLPKEVGIYFLKHSADYEQTIPVTEDMLKDAQFAIETHHMSTVSNTISDYQKKESPLCRWFTGQCDFYKLCFGQK